MDFPELKDQAIVQTRREPNLKLKRERELKGWAQGDVAEKIGSQPNLVTRWERGYAFPSPYYRQKLCELFDKTAEELGLIKGEITDTTKEPLRSESSPQEKDKDISIQTQPLIHHEEKRRFLSRRTIIIGLGSGIIAGGVAGGIWWQMLARHAVPAAPFNPLIYTYHTHPPTAVNDVKWSPRGTSLACVNGDKTVQILNAATGSVTITYRGHTNWTNSASWSPDEAHIASASADTTVQVWNLSDGILLKTYRGHTDAVWCVAWSPDGTRLVSGGKDAIIHVWDAFSGNTLTTYAGHTKGVWMVAWSPDSQNIASCGEDGTIQVWDAVTGQKSETFVYQGNLNSTIWEVGWSPDGKRLASASADTTVQIWDAFTGSHMLTCQGHTGSVQTVKWSPDGTFLASGSLDKTVRVWDALTGKQVGLYPYHSDEVYGVTWSPDGQRLASGSKDTTMQIYHQKFSQ